MFVCYLTVCSPRLGIWLFMSEMPYGTLSSSMLWRVLYVMQCAETAAPDTLNSTDNTYTCLQALRGTHTHIHNDDRNDLYSSSRFSKNPMY